MRIAPCTNFKLIINDILIDVAVEKNLLLLLFRVGHYMEVSTTVNMFRLVA